MVKKRGVSKEYAEIRNVFVSNNLVGGYSFIEDDMTSGYASYVPVDEVFEIAREYGIDTISLAGSSWELIGRKGWGEKVSVEEAEEAVLELAERLVKGGSRFAFVEDMPKGWTEESMKKFWKSVGGSFDKCVAKIKDVEGIDDPEAFCATAERASTGRWPRESYLKRQADLEFLYYNPPSDILDENIWREAVAKVSAEEGMEL